jgi:hypothetical protein
MVSCAGAGNAASRTNATPIDTRAVITNALPAV